MKVGFIGIGQMGRHMAGNVLKAGYDLTVHDADQNAAADLVNRGARWADTPREVAAAGDIVITSLPTPAVVESVVYGPEGLINGWKNGDVYVDMSTNSPSLVRKIAADAAAKGVAMLDAPVSGGTRGAEAATLTIIAGGDAAALGKARDVLSAMGPNIFHVGDIGCGNIAKLVNNMIGLACSSATAEGFALGAKAGIDPQTLFDIIKVSTGNNWSMLQYPTTVFQRNFEPGFKVSLAHKDINLALALGEECGLSLPVAEVTTRDLKKAMDEGYAEKGVDAVILNLEKQTGKEVRPA